MCKRHTAVTASAKLGPHQRIDRQNTAAQYMLNRSSSQERSTQFGTNGHASIVCLLRYTILLSHINTGYIFTLKYLLHLPSRAGISVHVDNVQGRVTLVVHTGDVSSTLRKEGERESDTERVILGYINFSTNIVLDIPLQSKPRRYINHIQCTESMHQQHSWQNSILSRPQHCIDVYREKERERD